MATLTEPLPRTDAAIEAALAEAHLPTLMMSLVHLTGDASILSDDMKPVYDIFADGRLGGFDEAKQARIRDRARAAIKAYLAGAQAAAPAGAGDRAADDGLHRRRPGARALHRHADGRAGGRRRRPEAPALGGAEAEVRGRQDEGRDRRRRHVGPPGRHPPAAGGRRLRDHREERRRRRHLAREHLPWLPRRQPEPPLRLFVRAEPRMADALLDPAGAARLLHGLRRQVRPAAAHPLQHPGQRGAVRRGRQALARHDQEPRRRRRDAERQCGDQRRRPAEPAAPAGHPRPRQLQGRGFPLGPLAPRRGPEGQARRLYRHRRQRLPVRAGDRAGRRQADRLPAHAALARADARLSPPGHARRTLAARARSLL